MTAVSPEVLAEAKSLLIGGRTSAALAAYRALVDAHPHAPNLRYGLGSALAANGDHAAAMDAWSTARIIHSLALMRDLGIDMDRLGVDGAYAAQTGRQLMQQGLPGVAASALAKAAETGNDAEAIADYGLAIAGFGLLGEALEALKSSHMLSPSPESHARLISLQVLNRDLAAGRTAEAVAWAQRYAGPADRPAIAPVEGRPLRVGYLATSFASDSLQRYALPAIANHAPDAVYPILYLAEGRGAPQDEQIRSLEGLDDQAAAQVIRRDRVDILVDMAGHGSGGRLGLFALNPAPVQVSWSRDPYTTGLTAIDYMIHADAMAGYDVEDLFVETVRSVGPVSAPYRAPQDEIATGPTPTPALAKGHVTFGFFGAPAWLADTTVALWGRILLKQPDSRLVLKHTLFDDPVVQRQTAARFAVHGVSDTRIEFRGATSGAFHVDEFADIDIGLQPAICVEPTPLMEMLSHGVPVLAVRGTDFQSRASAYPLTASGLSHLTSETSDAMAARAVALCADLGALAALRAEVLPAFLASPFSDAAGFARRLEAAYAEIAAAAAGGEVMLKRA